LARIWEWFIEGLAIAAPKSIREAGWRPAYCLIRRDPSAGGAAPSFIERSFLGAMRLAAPRKSADSLPLAIELPLKDAFETRADLPSEARGALREAIAHRLEALSPLPAADVTFAIGRVAPSRADRLDVHVAIIRKQTLWELLQSPEGPRIGLVGAGADERGCFRYVFHKSARAGANGGRTLYRMLAIAAAISICAFGADAQLDRRIEAMTAHEAALIRTLREEKDAARFLAAPPTPPPPTLSFDKVAADLARLSIDLPDGVWVEEISIGPSGLAASGYARRGLQWPETIAPTTTPSDRPGIDRIMFQLVEESGP
jgi:hypothetical protein